MKANEFEFWNATLTLVILIVGANAIVEIVTALKQALESACRFDHVAKPFGIAVAPVVTNKMLDEQRSLKSQAQCRLRLGLVGTRPVITAD